MKFTVNETAKRLYRLNAIYTNDYLSDLEKIEEEKKEIESVKENDEVICVLLTGEQNAKVTLRCMKDCINAVKALKKHQDELDNDDQWILAGINGMLDNADENGYNFDLPYVILKMLTYAD